MPSVEAALSLVQGGSYSTGVPPATALNFAAQTRSHSMIDSCLGNTSEPFTQDPT